MKEWFNALIAGFMALSATTWTLLALLLGVAAGLTLLMKKRGAKVTAAVWLVAVAAMAAVLAFATPEIYIEQGANTSAGFLYNPVFWAVSISLGGIAALVLLLRGQQFTARMLSAGALCTALAFLLSCMTLWRMPQGGSITPASMLPIFVFAYLYGAVPGVLAGTANGVLQLVQGAYVVHPVQFLLDYILPFAALGLAGLFRKQKQMPLGIVAGASLRFIIHVISGVVFFHMYAPPGQSVLAYSVVYNGSYMLPETAICVAVAMVPRFQRALSRAR